MSPHPSFLELDRFALGERSAAVAVHVGGCARCQQHLARLEPPERVPSWVSHLEAGTERRGWWARLPRIAAVPALAALAWLLLARAPTIASKGLPSVGVYVKHGAAVGLWDGRSPLAAGDQVRLKITAPGYARLAVASVTRTGITELYAGPLEAKGETLVPPSWKLDGEAGPERLVVVVSQAPLSAPQLEAAVRQAPRTADQWAIPLQFEKDGGRR